MLIWSLRKVFMLTTLGKQNSNNCDHVTNNLLSWIYLGARYKMHYLNPILFVLTATQLSALSDKSF